MTLTTGYGRNKKSTEQDMINNEQFIQIWGFMRREMKLEKTELLVFAVIYGFHRSCESFGGSIELLSQWTGSGANAIREALRSLVNKGYITKKSEGYGRTCSIEYNVNVSRLPKIEMHKRSMELARQEEISAR